MPSPWFRLPLDTDVTIPSSVVLLRPGRFVEFLVYEGDGDPQGNVLAYVVSAQPSILRAHGLPLSCWGWLMGT